MDGLFPERIMYGSAATSIRRNRSRPGAGQRSSSRALESPTALGDVVDGRTTPPRSHHAHCIRSPTRALTAVARAPAKLGCPIPAPTMCQQAARIKALSGTTRNNATPREGASYSEGCDVISYLVTLWVRSRRLSRLLRCSFS